MISPCQKATRGRKAGHELAAVNAHRFPRAKGEQPARGNRYDEHAFAKLFEDRLEGGRASPRAAQEILGGHPRYADPNAVISESYLAVDAVPGNPSPLGDSLFIREK